MHTFSRRLEPLVHRLKLQSHQAAVSPYPGGSPLVAAGVGVGWAACFLSAGRKACEWVGAFFPLPGGDPMLAVAVAVDDCYW